MSETYYTKEAGRRLDAWVSIQDKMSQSTGKLSNKTVTISREFGCEGYLLAEKLSKKMEEATGIPWTVFDRKLIELVCKSTDISFFSLDSFDSSAHHIDILSPFMKCWKTGEQLYELLAKRILKIAEYGNCIIVGRGASILTQKFTNCYHFRLEAPLEFRVNSIVQRSEMSYQEADLFVKENQKERIYFLKKFLNVESISDTSYYHMKFNNSKIDVDSMSDIITHYVQTNPNKSQLCENQTRPLESKASNLSF